MFTFLAKRKARRLAARHLYEEMQRQSRQPLFYSKYDVPDSFTGRFELLVLHAFLLWQRLAAEGKDGHALAQAVFDVMFRDLTWGLRHIGVGDLAVPHHARRMMRGYKGRVLAYYKALQADDPGLLADALRRNLFATVQEPPAESVDFFCGYVRNLADLVAGQDVNDIYNGKISWDLSDNDQEQTKRTHFNARMVA